MENQKKTKKIYSFRLSEESAEYLHKKAEEARRTASNYLDLMLKDLQQKENGNKKQGT